MKKLLLVTALLTTLVSCKQSGSNPSQSDLVNGFMDQLAQEYGSGYSYEFVKAGQDNSSFLVFTIWDGSTDYNFAVDFSNYRLGQSFYDYASTHTYFGGLTYYSDGTFSCSTGCHKFDDSPAYTSMTFEKTSGSTKDLEKAAAFAEAMAVESSAQKMAAEFGLSEERSLKVAKLSQSWQKLSKSRALTDSDANAFSKELVGVDVSKVKAAAQAVKEGSSNQMDEVLQRAAEVNGTTSENMAQIMSKFFNE